ncbi:MAG: 7-carboxy-7-deazaguanine synthase QueE [Campylobacteraceae bacterium]|jgi:6-pyruvoyltetrahydropterin 2'-reductase|nr:7-carboxy-7-deazaguanine synthase QueE [Campylobacteraceae bacterium]
MYLVESFLSIQGEGKYMGYPSLFVRFGGCNLQCKGFGCEFISPLNGSKLIGCDSLFAVDEEHFKNEWERFDDAQKLFLKVTSHVKSAGYLPHLVITGGEPLIHYKNPVFYGFLELALNYGFKIFFETNATINLDFKTFALYKKAGFAMSVKLSNSLEKYEKRINKKAIQNIVSHAKEAFFKFVVDKKMILNGSAQKEIEEITAGFDVPIFCMPLGSSAEIKKNSKITALFCIKNGYNYSHRIHIDLWGDKKGV